MTQAIGTFSDPSFEAMRTRPSFRAVAASRFHWLLLLMLMLMAPDISRADEVGEPDYVPYRQEGGGGPTVIRLSAAQGSHMAHVRILQSIARSIERDSDGLFKVDRLTNGQGGSEADLLKNQIRGRVEGGFTSAATLARSLPAFRLLTIPRLFNDERQVRRFIGSSLDDSLRATAANKGLKVLGYGSYGFYGILSFRQATDTDPGAMFNLNDLAVRAPTDDWLDRVYDILPLRTRRVPTGDLATALESGWVEGIAATAESLAPTPYPDRASVYFSARLLHGWTVFTVNRAWFVSLSPQLQGMIATTVEEAGKRSIEIAFATERKLLTRWSQRGQPRVVTLPPEDLAAHLRPLARKGARQAERAIGRPGDVHWLWENNQQPSARSSAAAGKRSPTPPTTSRPRRRVQERGPVLKAPAPVGVYDPQRPDGRADGTW